MSVFLYGGAEGSPHPDPQQLPDLVPLQREETQESRYLADPTRPYREPRCVTVYEESCTSVGEQECSTEYADVCVTLAEQQCVPHTEQQCVETEEQQCRETEQTVCGSIDVP